MRFKSRVAALLAGLCAASPLSAQDESSVTATAGYGYNSNPLLIPDGEESGFYELGGAAAWATARETYAFGGLAEARIRDYLDAAIESDENYRAAFVIANAGEADFTARAITLFNLIKSEDLRAEDALQRGRLAGTKGDLKPFIEAEVRTSSLGEGNGLFFETLRYNRGTVSPGASWLIAPWLEVGMAVEGSTTQYEEADAFGRIRDNKRVMPSVFVRYGKGDLSLVGAVSQLQGTWEGGFRDVDRTLFQAGAAYKLGKVTLSAEYSQTPQDTNFLVSPLTIASQGQVKLDWIVDAAHSVNVWARDLKIAYLGSDFMASAFSYGAGMSRVLNENAVLSFEINHTEAELIDGQEAERTLVMVSVKAAVQSNGAAGPAVNAQDFASTSRRRTRLD